MSHSSTQHVHTGMHSWVWCLSHCYQFMFCAASSRRKDTLCEVYIWAALYIRTEATLVHPYKKDFVPPASVSKSRHTGLTLHTLLVEYESSLYGARYDNFDLAKLEKFLRANIPNIDSILSTVELRRYREYLVMIEIKPNKWSRVCYTGLDAEDAMRNYLSQFDRAFGTKVSVQIDDGGSFCVGYIQKGRSTKQRRILVGSQSDICTADDYGEVWESMMAKLGKR